MKPNEKQTNHANDFVGEPPNDGLEEAIAAPKARTWDGGTALDLDAIEARANAATPIAKWSAGYIVEASKSDVDYKYAIGPRHEIFEPTEKAIADRDFIEHARTDVPALITRVRALESLRNDIADWVADHSNESDPPMRGLVAALDRAMER